MEKFVKRMIDEHKELAEKITKLGNFVECKKAIENISKDEYAMLRVQLEHMIGYFNILEDRLAYHGIYIIEGQYLTRADYDKTED